MQIRRYRDPALFLDRAGPFLSRAEGENNLFLGMGGRPGSTPPVLGEECYLATIERAEEVVACALRTPPYGVVIARADLSALELLIDDLTSKYETLPSVLGPEPAVSVFAQHWSQRAGTRTRPLMRMRLFEARHVRSPERHIPGVLRIAEERDLTMVTAWAVAFHHEARTSDPLDPVRTTREDVAKQRLYLWDNGGAVSMAIWAGRTGRSVRIGIAYTPSEHRRRGYASACVAALTQRLLDEGVAVCCINTDVTNTTTNKIYPAIRYRPVCDMSNIDLNAG